MITTFHGSVNTWECDENDHLNVRFYAHKMYQTLVGGLLDLGLVSQASLGELLDSLSITQMRFVNEARSAEPMTGFFAVLSSPAEPLLVLTELRHSGNDKIMAAFTYQFDAVDDVQVEDRFRLAELPIHAGYRGLTAKPLDYAKLSADQAETAGFLLVGRGVIQAEECDVNGRLLNYQYMGRNSDSMPNLFTKLKPTDASASLGGAVLEYQMYHYSPLSVGDRFVMYSGVHGLGNKTTHLAHLFFNLETDELVIASQVISISMDLVARKAIEIPAERRVALNQHLLKKLN